MNTDWYELIEKYNLGQLPAAQAAQFEAAMQADEGLAAEVRAHRTEWEMQELLAENLLRAEIRQRLTDLPDRATKPNKFAKYWKYLLPLLLLLGTTAYFIFLKQYNPTPQQPAQEPQENPVQENTPTSPLPENTAPKTQKPIAETPKQRDMRQLALAAYRAPDGLSGIRGANDDDALSLATKAFSEKNYRRVLELLEALPEDDRQEALSLRAHAHFNTGNFQSASRDFSELKAGGIYRREAEWFGILSRMAVPGADRAALKTELEQILKNADHPYLNDATALMKSAF